MRKVFIQKSSCTYSLIWTFLTFDDFIVVLMVFFLCENQNSTVFDDLFKEKNPSFYVNRVIYAQVNFNYTQIYLKITWAYLKIYGFIAKFRAIYDFRVDWVVLYSFIEIVE